MGNISSDIQVCECCPCPASRTTRTGSGKKSTSSIIPVVINPSSKNSVAPIETGGGHRAARVRKGSTGDNIGTVASVPNLTTVPVPHRRSHTYQLRSKTKERPNSFTGTDSDVKSIYAGAVRALSISEAKQYQTELSLAFAAKLSLGNKNKLVTNQIDNSDDDNVNSFLSKKGGKPEECECPIMEDLELPKHVLYYGWFFSEETSNIIFSVVMHFLHVCYDQVPQFQRFMLTCCKDEDIRDPFEYYKRPNKRAKPNDPLKYHTTAKFLGRKPDIPYQTLVEKFLDKIFRIHLVGLVFTPRTLGVRVKLTDAQQLIFDEKTPDEPCRRGVVDDAPKLPINEIRKQIEGELDGYRPALKKHLKVHPQCKLKNIPGNDDDAVIFRKWSTPRTATDGATITTTSRAHITIGVAPKVLAKQTGDDLVDIIDLEQRALTSSSSNNFQQDFQVTGAVLRQFGRHANAFVVYPEGEIIVPGKFNAFI